MTVIEPTLSLERRLLRDVDAVIALDEVGRGALAGPVCVGAALIGRPHLGRKRPVGLRDSKLLTEPRREALEPACREWPDAFAVGAASADEIEAVGITRALGLAATRALQLLSAAGAEIAATRILLDGSHDYLTPVAGMPLRVTTKVKADRDCASVACASVIAKVTRDREMIGHHAGAACYGWDANKGYASPVHIAAIQAEGPHRLHRTSWLSKILAPPAELDLGLGASALASS